MESGNVYLFYYEYISEFKADIWKYSNHNNCVYQQNRTFCFLPRVTCSSQLERLQVKTVRALIISTDKYIISEKKIIKYFLLINWFINIETAFFLCHIHYVDTDFTFSVAKQNLLQICVYCIIVSSFQKTRALLVITIEIVWDVNFLETKQN